MAPAEPHILGQRLAVAALAKAIGSGRLHHAWILHGPAGVGKFRVAEALARIHLDPLAGDAHRAALEPPAGTPTQRLIDAGTHPDFHVVRKELAALSESRELRERKQTNIPLDLLRERMLGGVAGDGSHHESLVFRTAVHGHGKAFIVDEAELLDADAQNAMLKTLEEPPPGTLIVLVTQHEDRLLPTIRSRCQRVAFGPLDRDAMDAWWRRSGLDVPPADRAFIEAFSEGSPGMATMALRHGLAAWNAELGPHLDEVESGGYPPALAERMAELAEEFAKGVVEEDDRASKEAANRLAVRLICQVLGMRIRGRLAASDDARELSRWIGASEALREFESQVRSNVNLKHAFANLVAQWAERAGRGTADAR
ncbi:MAG: hypothetical protein ACOYO7_02355 [Phycisphaerales bacterium]